MNQRTHDAEATRSAIMGAAFRLFNEKGVNGVSVSQLAKEAGVTKSLVHHHFGSKDELWNEIKQHAMGEYLQAQQELLETGSPQRSLLAKSMEMYFAHLQKNPDIVRMMLWMALEDDCKIPEKGLEVTDLGVARLREGQLDGDIRTDIDLRSLIALFLFSVEHWFQARDAFCAKHGFEMEGADQRYLDTMMKVIMRGIEPHEDDERLYDSSAPK